MKSDHFRAATKKGPRRAPGVRCALRLDQAVRGMRQWLAVPGQMSVQLSEHQHHPLGGALPLKAHASSENQAI